jgi:hypothetical protein
MELEPKNFLGGAGTGSAKKFFKKNSLFFVEKSNEFLRY